MLRYTRCMTKIKNCSKFSKADHFLIVWSLLSTKLIFSSKSVVLKRYTAQIPAAPPIHYNPALKSFSKQKFLKVWAFLESLHRNLSEK
jgi:hypothetical protein